MPYVPTPQTIVQADYDGLNTALQAIITTIQGMNNTNVALTKDERKFGVTIGKQRKAFSDFYFANKDTYPGFKPSQTKISEADAEQHYFIQDKAPVSLALIQLAMELLQDMQLNSEHYYYDYASEGRLAAQKGKVNGLPGADAWFDALDALYPKTGPKPEAEPVP